MCSGWSQFSIDIKICKSEFYSFFKAWICFIHILLLNVAQKCSDDTDKEGPLRAWVLFKQLWCHDHAKPRSNYWKFSSGHDGAVGGVCSGLPRFERAAAHGHGPRFTELRSVLRPDNSSHPLRRRWERERLWRWLWTFTAFNNQHRPVVRPQPLGPWIRVTLLTSV